MSTDDLNRLLQPLSPSNSLQDADEQFPVYQMFLEDAFGQSDIKNIALTGNFGAGKSSILRSFDKSQNGGKEKYLYISLADFELNGKVNGNQDFIETPFENKGTGEGANEGKKPPAQSQKDPAQETQKRVEYSLLCQILTRGRHYYLRDSNLYGIPEPPMRRGVPLILALFIALAFILIYPTRFAMLAEIMNIPPEYRSKIHTWMYAIALVGIVMMARYVFRHFRLKKLSLVSPYANAEMALQQNNTSLDLYKFELVYALERMAHRVKYTVVFEDMDRLDPKICLAVMSKLREINGMVNTRHRQLHRFSKKHIRFIYAVGEAVLNHTQRTKFYDCIIPVVPAMNRYNAETIICKMLRKHNVDIDNETVWVNLSRFFPFLSDYRTVITFCNEFEVMCRLFQVQENDCEKQDPTNDSLMLSLCFYKVMAPKSYALLFDEQRDGSLPYVAEEELAEEYQDETFRKQLVELLNSLHLSYQELEMLYLSKKSLCQKYIDILTTGGEARRIDVAHKIAEDTRVNLSNDLINKRVFENEKNPQIAIALADYIRINITQETGKYEEWFYAPAEPGDNRFTNCITYLSADPDNFQSGIKLPQVDHQKLWDWCIKSLPTLIGDEKHQSLWKAKMLDLLQLILEIDLENVPDSLMQIQLDGNQKVQDLINKSKNHKEQQLLSTMQEIICKVYKTDPDNITKDFFVNWCMGIFLDGEEVERLSLSRELYEKFPESIPLDLIQHQIVEYESEPDIAAILIACLFNTTNREKFDNWFLQLSPGHARKFSGSIRYLSENPNIIEERFAPNRLYEWAMCGLRVLSQDKEHLDVWDSKMCTTLRYILSKGYTTGIPEYMLRIRLTHDIIVADALQIDLDTTLEESMLVNKEEGDLNKVLLEK